MKFFFPDSQDQINPDFDFITEEHLALRVRQRDDLYAHEALDGHVIDGLLVSKAIVDGTAGSAGKYTAAQRNRLYRVGVRRFFRLDQTSNSSRSDDGRLRRLQLHRRGNPASNPGSGDRLLRRMRIRPGHLGGPCHLRLRPGRRHRPASSSSSSSGNRASRLTLELADVFLARSRARKVRFEPLGVAQGWSPASYAAAVRSLQKIGYKRIALGGMVPLKTPEILASLRAVSVAREPDTQLHLLGITRCSNISEFASYGVTSFDSTSAFRQAFKDDKDNYHTDGPHLHSNSRAAGGRAAETEEADPGGQGRPGTSHSKRTGMPARTARIRRGEVSAQHVIDALQRYNEITGLQDLP